MSKKELGTLGSLPSRVKEMAFENVYQPFQRASKTGQSKLFRCKKYA